MKNLLDHIYEGMSKDELIVVIRKALMSSDETTLQRIHNILSEKDLVDNLWDDYLDRYLVERGLGGIADVVKYYFEKNDDLPKIIEYVKNPTLTMDDIYRGSNLIGLITKLGKGLGDYSNNQDKSRGFKPASIQRLSKDITAPGIKVGEWEFVLRLFIDSLDLSKKNGDIVTKEGVGLEVKCGDARLGGAKTGPALNIQLVLDKWIEENIDESIRDNEFDKSLEAIYKGNKMGINFWRWLIYKKVIDYIQLKDILIDIYSSQYTNSIDVNQLKQLIQQLPKINNDNILATICTIMFYCYMLAEHFDYFIIINKKTSNYICLKADELDKVYDAFLKDINVKTFPSTKDNTFGKSIQIEYKG